MADDADQKNEQDSTPTKKTAAKKTAAKKTTKKAATKKTTAKRASSAKKDPDLLPVEKSGLTSVPQDVLNPAYAAPQE